MLDINNFGRIRSQSTRHRWVAPRLLLRRRRGWGPKIFAAMPLRICLFCCHTKFRRSFDDSEVLVFDLRAFSTRASLLYE
jgi:hypothetical protein